MTPAPAKTIVWLRPEQAEMVRTVADVAGLELVSAGSSDRGRAGEVAKALGVEPVDDLRTVLTRASVDLVWIASPGEFGTDHAGQDAAAIAAARSRGLRVATLEPIPAAALDLAHGGWLRNQTGSRAIDALQFVPLARCSTALREATDLLESYGPIRSLAIESLCRPEHGSLGARLFGAMELALTLIGVPDVVDAAFVAPAATTGLHALPSESLRALSGDLTANLRFPDGRAASIFASDHAGTWRRSITLLGPGGRLHATEQGFVWTGPDGAVLDEHRRADRPDAAPATVAESLARMLDPAAPSDPPVDHEAVLAMGQTALLSCRTGQPESPAMIRRMIEVS